MSTPQPPHAPHLDVETLADLQEGLLHGDQVTEVAAHLGDCLECRGTLDALDELRLLLAEHGAADIGATPEDVVRRLDDALAAAQPSVATASATVTPLPTSTRARSPWRTRTLQAAAVVVLVAAVGGIGYGGIRALNSSGGSAADSASSGSAAAGAGEKAGKYAITSSGRDYTQATLRAAVPALLAGSLRAPATDGLAGSPPPNSAQSDGSTPAPSASGSGSGSPKVDTQRLRNGAALASCVANLANGPVTPLAVDLGRFEGKPATIIVLPDPDDPSFVDVYAVAPDCPTGTFLTLERVVLP